MGKGEDIILLVRVDILKLLATAKRWTIGRKKAVLDALEVGLVTSEEVLKYDIDSKELASWERFRRMEDIAPDTEKETLPEEETSLNDRQLQGLTIGCWRFVLRSKSLVGPERLPRDVGVTLLQRKVLALLFEHCGKVVLRYHIYEALYRDQKKLPNEKIIDVIIWGLRNELESSKAGIVIDTIWGRGYRLSLGTPSAPEPQPEMAK